MSTQKVLAGVLAGLTAGVLLGVLFAPDKGSETRKKISQKGSDTLNDLNGKLDHLLGRLNNNLENVKEDANTLADKGISKVDEFKREAKNVMG